MIEGTGSVWKATKGVSGPRHPVIHEGRGQKLAVRVIDHALGDRLTDALRDAAMDLPLGQHRVHQVAEIVHDGVAHDLRVPGLPVDLDLGDMAAVGIGPARQRLVLRDLGQFRLPRPRAFSAASRSVTTTFEPGARNTPSSASKPTSVTSISSSRNEASPK
jgi:hypothetical protein